MAVNATPPLPKSQPDIARINTYTGTTITVTKHTGPRNTVGQSVVPTQQMPVKQILDLMTSLPLTYGPGFYHFTCSDTGGTGDDTWMVRLGPPEQEASMSGPGPGFPSPPGGPPAPVGPLSEGVRQIGPGYYYDENLGTLVTPWREIVQWRPGEALPKAPTNAAPHLSLVPPNAQPGQWPQMPGWGSFPATDDSRALKEMEARMAEERRQREREDDNRRRQEEREEQRREREEQRRREEQRDAQMVKLFETLHTKPTGPSDTELALRREIEETKRRLEEQTREEARRREDQQREDRYREDARIQREKTEAMLREIREKDSGRPDPLMTLMGTIMTSTQAQASESVRAVREAAAVASSANERHTSQIMEAMTRDKTGASEMTKQMLEGSKTMMEMQSSFYQQMLEQANSGGAPWYASAIQGALEKIGPIANAVATRNQQPQVQVMPPPRQPPASRAVAPGTVRPIPTVAGSPNLAGLPPATHTGERPDGVQYDAATETFIVPGGPGHPGYRVPAAFVGQHGWNETLKKLAQESAPSPVAAFAPPPAPPTAPPVLTVVPAPAPAAMNGAAPLGAGPAIGAAPAAPKTRGRGRKAAAPPPPAADPAVPQPADPKRGYSREEMEGFDHETMLAIVKPFDDATLFGDVWPYVQQLRGEPPAPDKAAEYVLQGKAQLAAAGRGAPAMDLLEAAQIDVFVERLFPEAPDEYQEAVAKAIASAMGLTVLEEAES